MLRTVHPPTCTTGAAAAEAGVTLTGVSYGVEPGTCRKVVRHGYKLRRETAPTDFTTIGATCIGPERS